MNKKFITNLNLKFPHVNISHGVKLRLYDKTQISKDTLVCKAEFLGSLDNYFIAPGLHLSIYSNTKVGNSFLSKRYTPLQYLDKKTISLLIKVYQNENGDNIGRVGSFINSSIQNNTNLSVDFPYGKIAYVNDMFYHKKESGNAIISSLESWDNLNLNKVGFIAAGTGITPIYRIIKELIQSKVKREISLLFLNYRESDLYFKDEITDLANHNHIKLKFLLTKDIISNSQYTTCSELNEDIILKFFGQPSDEFAIYSCGSKVMINNFIEPTLSKMNYKYYSF